MSNTRDDHKISLVIRACRGILGLNLRQLADILDVAASTIGKWESNDLTLKATTYMKLVKYLKSRGLEFDFVDNPNDSDDYEVIIKISQKCIDTDIDS